MEKISVFLADSQVLFREGIHFTLSGEEDINVIGEATNSEEAISFIEANSPRVAILNIEPEKLGGIAVTRRIKRNLPAVAVILVTDSDNEEHLLSAMKSGVSACLSKDTAPEELVNTVRTVVQGSQPISEALLKPGLASRVLNEFEELPTIGDQVDSLLAHLTPSEAELLHHLADGKSIEEICQSLSMTEESISRHFKLILSKLVSNDYAREVIEAMQNRLLSIIPKSILPDEVAEQYVTRNEFTAFQKDLMKRLKALTKTKD